MQTQITNDTIYKNFFLLRKLFRKDGTPKSIIWRLVLLFVGVYLIGVVVTGFDGSWVLYIRDGGTVLLLVSFVVTLLLVKALGEKFVLAFNGGFKDPDKSKGLLPAINFNDENGEFEAEYTKAFKERLGWITLEKSNAKRYYWSMIVLIVLIFLVLATYCPLKAKDAMGGWNFTWHPWGNKPSTDYFGGYLFNQLKDFFLYCIVVPPLLWQVFHITKATRLLVKLTADRKRFDIKPLSPDNACGLKMLGEISLVVFYIIMAQLIQMAWTTYVHAFPITHQILYPVIFIFAAIVFFLPLMSAHDSMKEAKLIELDRISKMFNELYSKYTGRTNKAEDLYSRKEAFESIVNIKDIYRDVERIPVWPYDIQTIGRFLSLFGPLVTAFIINIFTNKNSVFLSAERSKELNDFVESVLKLLK